MKTILAVLLIFLVSCQTVTTDKPVESHNNNDKLNIKSDNNVQPKIDSNNDIELSNNHENYVLKNGNLYTQNGSKIKRIIYFESDQYDIPSRYEQLILAHVKFLNDNKSIKIRIEGHADERGSREYNLALGYQRAIGVAQLFANKGLHNYKVVSFGEERPADADHNEFSWSRNRRVEIIYLSDDF